MSMPTACNGEVVLEDFGRRSDYIWGREGSARRRVVAEISGRDGGMAETAAPMCPGSMGRGTPADTN